MSESAQAVLEFWFGTSPDDATVIEEKGGTWWKKAAEFDEAIRARFGELRERGKRGELDDWLSSPRGRLALVIVLDQFSRNLFRGSAESFAADDRALRIALDGIAQGADRELRFVERTFMYTPLEHAEDRDVQRRSVELFETLRDEAPSSLTKTFDYYAGYARAHRDIVERFGRFPHRNQILGRTSTAEEMEFLLQPGSSF